MWAGEFHLTAGTPKPAQGGGTQPVPPDVREARRRRGLPWGKVAAHSPSHLKTTRKPWWRGFQPPGTQGSSPNVVTCPHVPEGGVGEPPFQGGPASPRGARVAARSQTACLQRCPFPQLAFSGRGRWDIARDAGETTRARAAAARLSIPGRDRPHQVALGGLGQEGAASGFPEAPPQAHAAARRRFLPTGDGGVDHAAQLVQKQHIG